MAIEITKRFHPKTKSEWRTWLDRNHDREREVWVVLYKKTSGKQAVTLSELIDEALCFGWIDSMEKGVDKEAYAIRFTPRRNKNKWSEINKKRYKELLSQGLITEVGKRAYKGGMD